VQVGQHVQVVRVLDHHSRARGERGLDEGDGVLAAPM
jgi:hypothetical protein